MCPDSIVFDRAADYYDETRGFPPGIEGHVASLIREAGNLTPSSRVIEIGIGTGRIALPLSAHVRAVYGVDLSRPMLQRLLNKRHSEPVSVAEGDITRLPFESHALDAAVAVHIFHLVPDWRGALRELARVLRPEAPLIHGSGGGETSFDKLWEAWNTVLPAGLGASIGVQRDHIKTFPLEEGWRLAGTEQQYEYVQYQTPRTFLDRAQRRVWSRTWKVTDEELVQAIAAMRAAADQYFGDLDKPVLLTSCFRVQVFLPPMT